MLGFLCYATYNGALFWSEEVRQEYARTHSGRLPAVHANDLFFSIHASVITTLILVQCIIYDRAGHKPSKTSVLGVSAVIIISVAWCMVIAASLEKSWLPLLYFLSMIKLGISIVK